MLYILCIIILGLPHFSRPQMSSGSTLRDLLRRGRATFAAKTAVLCDLRIVISLPSGYD